MLERSSGSVIAGYRIEDVIGRGGMGVVYRAIDVALGRTVALKLIAPECMDDPKFRERFARELRYVASIDHPNVIPVHHAAQHEGVQFIVMRHVMGTDLRALMIEQPRGLDPQRAARIVAQIAMALDAAHAHGVVHRDVKPANVLIERRDGRDHVYLTDFGLSRHLTSAAGLTLPGQFVGTVDYVAPEQISGETVDGRADVYALGCVLFHALTGQPPYASRQNEAAKLWAHMYEPPPVVAELGSAPPAFDAVVRRAMAKQRDDRYPSAGELGRAALDATLPPPRVDDATRDASLGSLLPAGAADRPAPAGVPSEPVPSAPPTRSDVARSRAQDPPQPETPHVSVVSHPGRRVVVSAAALVFVVAAVAAVLTTVGGGSDPSADGPRVVSTIAVGREPADVAVGRGAIWVANGADGRLTRIDPRSERTRALRAGDDPGALAVGEGALWVADALNRLDRLDPRTGRLLGPPRRLRTEPYDVAVDQRAVWLANGLKGTVTRLDVHSPNGGETSIRVGQTPTSLAVRAGIVWVVNSDSGSVSRIDARTGASLSDPIRVGEAPSALAVAFGSVWVANQDSDTVTRIDAQTGEVRGPPIRVGRQPSAVAAGSDAIWVANSGSNTVSRIDPRTAEAVGPPIAVGRSPAAVAVGDGAVWVANAASNDLSRIEP